MSMLSFRLIVLYFLLISLAPAAAAEPVDFLRDVRPLLAGHCLKCHGPDEEQRQGGLRLDVRESALAAADSGERAIVPGKPDASELVRRIFSTDESEQMPPPDIKHPLTDAQKQILRQWIEQGADYQPHWAFTPPTDQPLPQVKQRHWPQNAIDAFILARLESEGLTPSPEADRFTIVRRVYLDLIGLPPTPAEADAFVNDRSPDAYERLVDRLLASPQYGERWARRWLDLARYADTNGYEKDRPRSIWPYRDWVIRALNADLPFDQFSIEQLAGDMLLGATDQQRIATGFHRNTMLNEEGGIDPQEFRFYALVDRVNTTSTVWLGLTLGCAQCHTHKYDPIPHEDYYRMLGLLNNTVEPEMPVVTAELDARRAEVERRIAERTAALPSRFPLPTDELAKGQPDEARRAAHLEQKFSGWLSDERAKQIHWTVVAPVEATSNLPRLRVLADGSVLVDGDQSKRDVYDLKLQSPLDRVTAIRLEALPDDSLPKRGPGRVYYEGPAGDFFLSEVKLDAAGDAIGVGGATQSFASGKATAAAAIDGNPLTGWSVNGGQGKPHEAIFQLASPLERSQLLHLQLIFERYYAAGLGRFRLSVTADERSTLEAAAMPDDLQRLLAKPADELMQDERERLLTYYISVAPELAEERKAIDELRKQIPQPPTTLVMQERPADFARTTRLYKRGEFLSPAGEVQPGVPTLIPPVGEHEPTNRLELAEWLFEPGHALTGRVAVNRHWDAIFGRGIVRTTGDFGFQGDLPTHGELLDWLALELPRRDWSIKALHRLLVSSSTYRQSSHVSDSLLAKDPDNKLLARGPRGRLEAEIIRDAALAASGLLSSKMLGPSVFPPQPASITTEGTYGPLKWTVSTGEDRYRRSLYTFAKRSAPFALLTTFDAPSGEACIARRDVSDTPLQALSLLNDTTFVEAAQALGREIAVSPGDDSAKAVELFRSVLTRPPQEKEVAQLVSFYHAQLARLEAKELDAAAIGGTSSSNAAAAWTLVARVLLNLDETVSRR